MSGLAATVTDLYARARRALADGDAASWEAARAMTELSDMGQSQRQIADGVGCSQQTVSNYVRVYRYHVRSKSLPAFREAMLEVRGGTWGNELPKAPEKRAAIAAELLSEKAVLEQPAVQRAVTREADRQTRQRIEQMDQAPSRTERAREQRRTSVTVKKMFWTDLYVALTHAARLLNDATSELDRTGMPAGRSGDILKASRVVEKAAKRFSAAATLRAVGAPMDDTGTA